MLALSVAGLPSPGIAAAFSVLPPSGGGTCSAMLRRIPPEKLWIGKFSGGRHVEIEFVGEELDDYTTEACFARKADCERWMYRLKSMYQDQPRWNYCMPYTRQHSRPPRW